MCGIAGLLFDVPTDGGEVLLAMTEAMRHRGPDGRGHIALRPGQACNAPATDLPTSGLARVFLGHRRLSIIDPRGTPQPLSNEDGSIWVVFNGEIYNYRELRQRLSDQGHHLREQGDTEVLVHLWEEFGEAMLEHLNGMFALAIYDTRSDTLFLARDRFGEKPLYYHEGPGLFAFASELHVLPLVPGFPDEQLDQEAMAHFFTLGYIPHPQTVYCAAHCLPPGHFLIRRAKATRLGAYWCPQVTGREVDLDLEALGAALDAAVDSRLVADVPIGCFLSGGLDSSLIAASMARRGAPRTFTISTGNWAGDETDTARRIAAHLGTEHQEFRVESNFVAVIERLAWHFGQPFADYSAVPTYYVSRETRRHVKVALSGDGGDELFAGYDRYANMTAAHLCGLMPQLTRGVLAKLLAHFPGGDAGSHLADFVLSASAPSRKVDAPSSLFHAHWRQICLQQSFLDTVGGVHSPVFHLLGRRFQQSAGDDTVSRALETDQVFYLPADILTKMDIAAMSVSLETRAPFLDHNLVEAANRLASSVKLHGRQGKVPLRTLARQRLPPEISGLPKRGFTLPLAEWMRHDIRDWCHAVLFDAPEVWEPFLRRRAVFQLWEDHQHRRADHAMRLWSVIALGLWQRRRKEPARVMEMSRGC